MSDSDVDKTGPSESEGRQPILDAADHKQDRALAEGHGVSLGSEPPRNRKLFSTISLIVGVLGIGFAVYSHVSNHRSREPTFQAVRERPTIFRAGEAGDADIHLVGPDGEVIEGDVHALTFYFWNDGVKPIRDAHIRRSVQLTIDDPAARVLGEPVVLKRSMGDVTQFSVTKVGRATVEMLFETLEYREGARCQLFYQGNVDAPLLVAGHIEEAGPIAIREEGDQTPRNKLLAIVVVLCIAGLFVVMLLDKYEKFGQGGQRVAMVCLGLVLLVCLGAVLLVEHRIPESLSPDPGGVARSKETPASDLSGGAVTAACHGRHRPPCPSQKGDWADTVDRTDPGVAIPKRDQMLE